MSASTTNLTILEHVDVEMAAVEEQPELLIEDLPEEDDEQEHDQLPTVHEVKANLQGIHTQNRKKIYLVVAAVLGVAALIVSSFFLSTKTKKATIFETRGEEVIQYLFDNQITELPDLYDTHSAQHRAAMFVADGDNYRMPMTQKTHLQFIERYVLALLYYHFTGPEWTYNLKFLDATHHCEWWQEFSTTAGDSLRMGVLCDDNGLVKKINLGKQPRVHHNHGTSIRCGFIVSSLLQRCIRLQYDIYSIQQLAGKCHSWRNQTLS
jgi:hypothetical protein